MQRSLPALARVWKFFSHCRREEAGFELRRNIAIEYRFAETAGKRINARDA
jgi:hypothetical protein